MRNSARASDSVMRRPNRHLIEDLQRALGTDDLFEWIEHRCGQLAAQGTRAGRVKILPSLLKAAGVNELVRQPGMAAVGQLSPLPSGGFRISVCKLATRSDRRFWIAHEIAHTLWFRRGSNRIPISVMQPRHGIDPTIEWLCDRAAAALLVPKVFLEDSQRVSLSRLQSGELHLFRACADELDVPPRVLARRIWHEVRGRDSVVLAVQDGGDGLPLDDTGNVGFIRDSGSGNVGAIIRWAAFPECFTPSSRWKVERKRVPADSMPQAAHGESGDVQLDGRWRSFLRSCVRDKRAKSFLQCSHGPLLNVRAGRCGGTVILDIPMHELAPA